MKKIDEILNIQKAILINEQLRKELNENEEPNVIGQEGISKRIAELTQQIVTLEQEVKYLQNDINNKKSKIRALKTEMEKWEKKISPNQTTMFDMDLF